MFENYSYYIECISNVNFSQVLLQVALWINGERNTNGDFVFSNNQLINSSSFDGYPNWALNKSSSNLSNDALLFTTYLNLDPATAEPNNSTKIFYWMDVNRNNLAGFICEKQSKYAITAMQFAMCNVYRAYAPYSEFALTHFYKMD